MNRCGECTLCCEVLLIDEIGKLAGRLCEHACNGCKIYDRRPDSCRRFFCLWVANPSFLLELRPDKCGVLFEPGGDHVILANVDMARPNSWRAGVGGDFVRKCLQDGYALIVQIGPTKHTLVPEGQTPASVWVRAREDAQRRGYL